MLVARLRSSASTAAFPVLSAAGAESGVDLRSLILSGPVVVPWLGVAARDRDVAFAAVLPLVTQSLPPLHIVSAPHPSHSMVSSSSSSPVVGPVTAARPVLVEVEAAAAVDDDDDEDDDDGGGDGLAGEDEGHPAKRDSERAPSHSLRH